MVVVVVIVVMVLNKNYSKYKLPPIKVTSVGSRVFAQALFYSRDFLD